MMSIEVSWDFESPRILVSKTRSDPLLVMGMVRPQQFVLEGQVLQRVLTGVWEPAVKKRMKGEDITKGFCGFWRRVGVFVAEAE